MFILCCPKNTLICKIDTVYRCIVFNGKTHFTHILHKEKRFKKISYIIYLSRMCGGARNEEAVELLLNTLFGNIEIAGEQVHTKMTLILDKDTGNTEDL